MDERDTTRAVNLLIEARRRSIPIDVLPLECIPASIEEAYAIQAGVAARSGQVVGYKAGATETDVPPRGAPVFRELVHRSPADMSISGSVEAEAEIAFSFGVDLPPRPDGYSDAEVFDAVGAVHAAIEIAGSRYRDVAKVSPLAKLADNSSNAAVILGEGRSDWRAFDLLRAPVCLLRSGREVASATGRKDGLDPKVNLPWLANVYALRYGGIKRGTFAITGSLTGLTKARAGDHIVVDFGPIGRVEVTFRV